MNIASPVKKISSINIEPFVGAIKCTKAARSNGVTLVLTARGAVRICQRVGRIQTLHRLNRSGKDVVACLCLLGVITKDERNEHNNWVTTQLREVEQAEHLHYIRREAKKLGFRLEEAA